ncbi:uncharacterized protein LOC126966896 [Leptidea sinapis]|uniref:uncharacterized protein LOC126966896 n=1 Tax=Leptidea sinapis TaxID=189913 RepID=UPI0021C2D032|nr:uncharacterized protein LOC126966896 [Leptidea sinapis]
MAVSRFQGKTKYVQETVEYDDDATQADSPPSQKRPKVGEYIANASSSPNSSQDIFTELQKNNWQATEVNGIPTRDFIYKRSPNVSNISSAPRFYPRLTGTIYFLGIKSSL